MLSPGVRDPRPRGHPATMSTSEFPQHQGQRGLATYRQLRDAGWTEAQIRHLRATRRQCPFRSVVAPHRGPLDAETLTTAAALWAGPEAVLTGMAALREFRLGRAGQHTRYFLVPASARARQSRSARTVRTCRDIPVARRSGVLRVTTAARALADAATYERVRSTDLEAIAIAALQRGLSRPEELERELWQRPQRLVAPVRKGLDTFQGGAWSRPEGVLREIFEAETGLPELLTNVGLETVPEGRFVGCPDGYLPELGVAIQVHSREHHAGFDDEGNDRWARTVEKDADYVPVGVKVLGVTPWTLYAQPRRFVRHVLQLVELGPPSPLPAVRVAPPPPRRRNG